MLSLYSQYGGIRKHGIGDRDPVLVWKGLISSSSWEETQATLKVGKEYDWEIITTLLEREDIWNYLQITS